MSNYILLMIGISAVALLGYRGQAGPFSWVLLLWAIVFFVRSSRDMWLLAIVGAVTIAECLEAKRNSGGQQTTYPVWSIVIGIVFVIAGTCWFTGVSSKKLQAETAATFPAGAVEFVDAGAQWPVIQRLQLGRISDLEPGRAPGFHGRAYQRTWHAPHPSFGCHLARSA